MSPQDVERIAKPLVGRSFAIVSSRDYEDGRKLVAEIVPPVLDYGDCLLFFVTDPEKGVIPPLFSWECEMISSLCEYVGEATVELQYAGTH